MFFRTIARLRRSKTNAEKTRSPKGKFDGFYPTRVRPPSSNRRKEKQEGSKGEETRRARTRGRKGRKETERE